MLRQVAPKNEDASVRVLKFAWIIVLRDIFHEKSQPRTFAVERFQGKFTVHPHMLRHACGYKLANDGHDTRSLQAYLGHKNIQHTVRYTELAPTRFKDFWR